ncbi:hypothetical protein [Pseudochrobactrum asaccharolyticum]|uniref:hypothetical protein n=1 Tax=Pseudochrobactrum asaccharolyticum TaxID=354351 RepID=UPI0040429456
MGGEGESEYLEKKNPTSNGGVEVGFRGGFHIERWVMALIVIVLCKINGGKGFLVGGYNEGNLTGA